MGTLTLLQALGVQLEGMASNCFIAERNYSSTFRHHSAAYI
ncbi:hypothetical protein AG1IA_05137 [Rhizoctonia solani AG-1 IA]|uniref:Uncharacterized protein n=1 Tax=Thanatephorus cucumeris (strain AG1-IA) TaxID=983506 RepID=L8WS95_THACA|nr:hypothetical protein AG1IA_05137 [Rhizoctonia solani AG-1 IA]